MALLWCMVQKHHCKNARLPGLIQVKINQQHLWLNFDYHKKDNACVSTVKYCKIIFWKQNVLS